MKSKLLLFLFGAAVIFLSSCSHCIKGSGNVTTLERSISGFSKVRMEGSYNVHFIRDSVQYVRITTDDNLLPYVETKVSNGVLEIDEKNHTCIRKVSRSDVYVHTPSISGITLDGSGNATCESRFTGGQLDLKIKGSGDMDMDFEGTQVNASIDGSGKIHLRGSANRGEYRIEGSGKIQAEEFLVQDAYAKISGSGNIETAVSNSLQVHISGSGNIWYTGSPTTEVNISGSGKVRKK